jgi:hypothetical protein
MSRIDLLRLYEQFLIINDLLTEEDRLAAKGSASGDHAPSPPPAD